MKALIRLIAFTVIIILGAENALETCVHLSSSSIHLSSTSHHSTDSTSKDTTPHCPCTTACNSILKISSEAPSLMVISTTPHFRDSYPEKHLLSSQFYSLLIKPPIA